MNKNFILTSSVIIFLSFTVFPQAQAQETLTIATYYPSPHGVYQELRTQRMVIGLNYYDSTHCWTPAACANQIDANADLVVEGNVGIGTTSPVSVLNVVNTSSAYPRNIVNDQYSNNVEAAQLNLRKARGTPSSPAAILVGDNIGRLIFTAYNGVAFPNIDADPNYLAGAAIRAVADENWTTTANGTFLHFYTTAKQTAFSTERMRIASNGDVGIGTTNPATRLEVQGGAVKTTDGLIIETRNGTDPTAPVVGQIWLRTDINP